MDEREYRLMLLVGILVIAVGLLAHKFESKVAAITSLSVGGLIFLAGLVGLFWNSD